MKPTSLIKRTTIALFGAVITLSLFAFMAKLVDTEHPQQTYAIAMPDIDLSFTPKETEVVEKVVEIKPHDPIVVPPIPRSEPASENNGFNVIPVEMPRLDTPSRNYNRGHNNSDAYPMIQVSPQYPVSAAQDGKEGYVVVGFDISRTGRVENIKIIQAKPKRIFNRAAIEAVKKWKYKPKLENGEAVHQLNQQVQLDFKIDQQI
ncbi:energy transducer TonB [Shewanella colwelliana]|uniref:energy transducer TonB n=1 Tax=Shewanella colwelliana TaxID=23 RepID=UPI0022B02A5C|nr:energy transducer TonB [Shewanella colwelliana]MCZ4338228.1 energy transducer TonB [Shewanella colwelliana]